MKKSFTIFLVLISISLGVYLIAGKNNYLNRFELGASAFFDAFNEKPYSDLANEEVDSNYTYDDGTWDMFSEVEEIDTTVVYSGNTHGYLTKYIDNAIAAHDSFNDRFVEIFGTVTRTYVNPEGQGIVVLDEVVHAVLAPEAREGFAKVGFLHSIRLSCLGAPVSNDLIIVRGCSIVETPGKS